MFNNLWILGYRLKNRIVFCNSVEWTCTVSVLYQLYVLFLWAVFLKWKVLHNLKNTYILSGPSLYGKDCSHIGRKQYFSCIVLFFLSFFLYVLGPSPDCKGYSHRERLLLLILSIIIIIIIIFTPSPNAKTNLTLHIHPATSEIQYFWPVAHGWRKMLKWHPLEILKSWAPCASFT